MELKRAGRWTRLEVAVTLAAVPIAARLLPWPILARLVTRAVVEPEGAARLTTLEALVVRRGWRSWCVCLPRAILRCRYLRQQGVAAELFLGVRRGSRRWEGHAWVMVDGRPYGETALPENWITTWSTRRGAT